MNRLKQIRERKSLTLAQLSARTSIPLVVLGDYENNQADISPAHLKLLSKALWVKPEELVPPGGSAPLHEAAPHAPMPAPAPAPGGQPGDPTPAGPAGPGPQAPPAPAAPQGYAPARAYAPTPAYSAPRPPRPNGPPPPAAAAGGGARPAARGRREPVVMPATDGQITEILRLAARLNLSTEELENEFGRGIDNITRFDAREWIKKLREDAIAKAPPAKVHFGQWPGLKEDREAVYLTEQRDARAELRVTLFNGDVFSGRIADFTPYTITIEDPERAEQVVLRKLAIAYYQRTGEAPVNGETEAPAKEIAPFSGPTTPAFGQPATPAAPAGVDGGSG